MAKVSDSSDPGDVELEQKFDAHYGHKEPSTSNSPDAPLLAEVNHQFGTFDGKKANGLNVGDSRQRVQLCLHRGMQPRLSAEEVGRIQDGVYFTKYAIAGTVYVQPLTLRMDQQSQCIHCDDSIWIAAVHAAVSMRYLLCSAVLCPEWDDEGPN